MTDSTTPIHTFTADDIRRGTLSAMPQVVRYPATIWRNRGLVWNFFRRELLSRFRGSLLGIAWVLVQPLFLFAVYFMVFGILLGPKIGGGPNTAFAVYLFAGIIGWSWFSEATLRATTIIVENGNLVKKVAFPCELLPVPVVMVAGLVYLVASGVLFAVGLTMGWLQPDWRLLCWPLVIAVHLAFTLGVGLILANLYVFARDVSHLYNVLSMAWFFMTPIFFLPQVLTDAFKNYPTLATLLEWNPMWPLVMSHRHVFGIPGIEVYGSFFANLGIAAAWAVGFLAIGYGSFVVRKSRYADLV